MVEIDPTTQAAVAPNRTDRTTDIATKVTASPMISNRFMARLLLLLAFRWAGEALEYQDLCLRYSTGPY
jgi:hypothetical protein